MSKITIPKNPLHIMIFAFVGSFVLAIFFGGKGLSDPSKVLLTVTSFLFGFYINNLITQSRSRHSKVVEALREEGGYIKAIYFMTGSVFPKSVIDEERELIDNYMMVGMDYKVDDYASSSKEFRTLFEYLLSMDPKTKAQDIAWGHIVRIIGEISKGRTRIETQVKERVSSFEWLTVLSLLSLVMFFVYSLNTRKLTSVFITSFIAVALTMIIATLRSLDTLQWKENEYFWEPIQELFVDLDLLPYYPKILVDNGRLQLKKGRPTRLADFPHHYPDMRDKTITVHE